jgi:hypothetical protein
MGDVAVRSRIEGGNRRWLHGRTVRQDNMKSVSPEARARPILKRLPPSRPVTVVEVGVFVGTLSRYLLSARADLRLIMVDNWAATDIQPESYKKTGDRHAYQSIEECVTYRLAAKRNVHEFRGRVKVLAMPSIEAAAIVPDASVDLVFIDADHSEEGAAGDIEAWQSKPMRGGYIGGHDFARSSDIWDLSGVERAVRSWILKDEKRKLELDTDTTWFCRC